MCNPANIGNRWYNVCVSQDHFCADYKGHITNHLNKFWITSPSLCLFSHCFKCDWLRVFQMSPSPCVYEWHCNLSSAYRCYCVVGDYERYRPVQTNTTELDSRTLYRMSNKSCMFLTKTVKYFYKLTMMKGQNTLNMRFCPKVLSWKYRFDIFKGPITIDKAQLHKSIVALWLLPHILEHRPTVILC